MSGPARLGLAPSPRYYVAPTVLVAVLGLVLSLVAWFAAGRWQDRDAEDEFAAKAANHLALLRDGFADFEDAMSAYHGFIEGAAGAIDPERLDRFATPLVEKFQGLADLAWAVRATDAEQSNIEAAARRDDLREHPISGLAGLGKRDAPGNLGEHYPIFYATPREFERNLAGFDLNTGPVRRAALEQARDSGEVAVSGILPLQIGAVGVIAVQPVYAGGARPSSVDERRRNLIGFAVGAFRLGPMVDGALARFSAPAGINIYIYDAGAQAEDLPLYVHASRQADAPALPLRLKAAEAPLHVSGVVRLGNQPFLAVFAPVREAHGLWTSEALATFAGCLVLSAVGCGYTRRESRRRQQEALLAIEVRTSEERLSTIFDSVTDGIFLVDPKTGTFVDVNKAGCGMFGYAPGELVGSTILAVSSGIPPYTEAAVTEYFLKAQSGGLQNFEWQAKRKDGSLFWIEVSLRIAAFYSTSDVGFAVVRDITERKRASDQMEQMARYDLLTGLANRRVFVEALEQAIARAQRGAKSFAVLYLDLDHFKDVNDTLGHPVGDLLLQAVGDRLQTSVRATDVVARFGGDEFAVILSDIEGPRNAALVPEKIQGANCEAVAVQEAAEIVAGVADKILRALSRPFSIQGNEIHSGATVGIAVYGEDSPDSETMLSHADVALYKAKSEARGTYRFFTDVMDAEVRARVKLSTELRAAIASGQFFLVYQPQVDIDTGRIVGMEALARWRHPIRGNLGPAEFIEAAETNGLIVPLGRWVMREACRQIRKWSDAGVAPPVVAINISGVQCKTPPALQADIAAALEEFSVPAARLELELTESVLMQASHQHRDLLVALHNNGHRIAIDDFGTGYSSLSYLCRYPVDRIKIGQIFITGIGKVPANDAIVRAALGLARTLEMEAVVEGVETAEQLALLKAWGGRTIQGYFFSRPLPVAEATSLLRTGTVLRHQRDDADHAIANRSAYADANENFDRG
jgi:diguanylate cyclase (GGDEF)-like protein/PAS domain S-box-containing protein